MSRRVLRWLVLLGAGLLMLAGCGTSTTPTTAAGSAVLATPAPSPAATGPTPAAATPSPAAGAVTITQGDDGRTLSVRVGDSVLLKLGEDRSWAVSIDNPDVLSRVRNVLLVRGAQGLYKVAQPGTAVVTADGSAICGTPGSACPANAVHIQVTVVAR